MQQQKPFIAAYLFDGAGATVTERDAKLLDRVNYAFGIVKDGRVSGAHWKHAGQLADLKRMNPALKTVLSIGGWGAGGFSDAVVTHAGRERFAQSSVELMLEHDFDGIDLDWEYPTLDDAGIDARPEDKFNFTHMMRLIRAKLDALSIITKRRYVLSMAVGCGTARYARIMELPELAEFLDEVNLMTYDMRHGTTTTTGHHTNLYSSPGDSRPASAHYSIGVFEKAGVPRSMMVMGAAFYGRGWAGVEQVGSGLHAPASGKALEFRGSYTALAADYIDKNGYKRYFDEDAQAPYLFSGDAFISYDDPQSLAAKARYVKEHDMKGIMFWEYANDGTGTLIPAIYDALTGG